MKTFNQYLERKIGWIAIILISILLTGCSKPIELKCQNKTINNTIYEITYNTTIKEVPGNCSNETIFISSSNNSCDISLINQINRLESIINKWAMTDINITINITNSTGVNET